MSANRPRREGSQWLFVARLLSGQERYLAATRRLWQGYFAPLLDSLRDPASPDWAVTGERVTRWDGRPPRWAEALSVERECALEDDGVRVRLALHGTAPEVDRIEYVLPAAARDVDVKGDGLDVRRRGQRLTARPTRAAFRFDVTYRL